MDMVEENPEDVALHAARHARVTLEAGFTTVRDLGEIGGAGDAIFALKKAVAKGLVVGPRIFAAGSIISPTGGHGITCGYRDDINLLFDPSGRADGADGCRAAVRRQVSRGADLIKFVATGGVLTETDTGTGQQFFDDEYAAIVGTAHMLGRKATAHAHGADGMKGALKAGVDSIEHGTFMDEEVIDIMQRARRLLRADDAGRRQRGRDGDEAEHSCRRRSRKRRWPWARISRDARGARMRRG